MSADRIQTAESQRLSSISPGDFSYAPSVDHSGVWCAHFRSVHYCDRTVVAVITCLLVEYINIRNLNNRTTFTTAFPTTITRSARCRNHCPQLSDPHQRTEPAVAQTCLYHFIIAHPLHYLHRFSAKPLTWLRPLSRESLGNTRSTTAEKAVETGEDGLCDSAVSERPWRTTREREQALVSSSLPWLGSVRTRVCERLDEFSVF